MSANSSAAFLDLADATVITFLTPSMVAIFSALFLEQPFTRREKLASVMALLGVMSIARPPLLFGTPYGAIEKMSTSIEEAFRSLDTKDEVTAADRLTGTMLAVVSAVGGAGSLIAIRTIGGRAHPFTTTSYFAGTCTLVGGATLAVAPFIGYQQPQLRFALPSGLFQWAFVVTIIVLGMVAQLLLTAGVASETQSNKAPAMMYAGMLWTAALDCWVFGVKMHWSSFVGCCLIVGGAVWIALQPTAKTQSKQYTLGAADAFIGDVEGDAGRDETAERGILLELQRFSDDSHYSTRVSTSMDPETTGPLLRRLE